MAQTAGGTYYAASSELVSSWPATSLDLANQLESRFAAKAPVASPTFTGTVALPSTTTLNGVTLRNGRVLQLLSTTKSDVFSVTSTSFTDVTGLSVSITPSSSSSTIFVILSINMSGGSNDTIQQYRLMRGTTAICVGDAAGSRTRSSGIFQVAASGGSDQMLALSSTVLDSPATTSATTYKVQVLGNSGVTYVNRAGVDTDSAVRGRTASSITVLEIA